MGANHVEGDFSLLQQLNQELPGHAKNLAGFHRGEFVPALQDRDGITGSQISQQSKQERIEVVGQNLGLAVGADELRLGLAKLGVDVDNFFLLFWRNINGLGLAFLCHRPPLRVSVYWEAYRIDAIYATN